MLKTEAMASVLGLRHTRRNASLVSKAPVSPSTARSAMFALGEAESEPKNGFFFVFFKCGRSLITSEGWTQEASQHIFLETS